MFRWLFQIVFAFGLLLVAACSTKRDVPPEPTTGNSAAPAGSFPLTITDHLGRKVSLPGRPGRIISLAPSITENLFAVGAGEQVVGVTGFCNYPPEAKERQIVGELTAASLSLERIVSLKPDLVIVSVRFHGGMVDRLAQFGIAVVAVDPESIDALYKTMLLIGKITGNDAKARQAVTELKARVDKVRAKLAGIATDRRARVFYQVFDNPLMAATRQSYIGEMVELAGGDNIFSDMKDAYPTVSLESVVARNPQVILAPKHGNNVSRIMSKPAASQIDAVKAKRIHLLEPDLVSRPGPRLAEALEAVARAIYPERFGPPDSPANGQSTKGLGK